MPRLPRPRISGGVYHVYTRGVRRTAIFVDDDDRAIFLALLGLVALKFEWTIEAYCLMGNHYHLVIRTPHPNISEGMQMLNSRYAMLFNAKYGLSGHVFEARYKHKVIRDHQHLLDELTYVEHNPVRHRICAHATDWPWSSARRRSAPATVAPIDLVTVIAFHSSSLDQATERFQRIVRSRFGAHRHRGRSP